MFAKPLKRQLSLNDVYFLQCIGFVACLSIAFTCLSSVFASTVNVSNILTASAVIGLMSLGSTFVIASGAIDLSTSAAMALAGVVCAWVSQHFGVSPLVAALVAVSTGAVCGLVTGWLVNVTRAPSFIITLGMLSIDRALAFIITGGIPICGLSDNITVICQTTLLGIPLPAALMLIAGLIAHFLLKETKFGTHTLLLGDSPIAAQEMGILVDRLRLKVFTLAGVFSGFAGFIFMARTSSGDPSAGQNYELVAITAVVLGGANLFGGRGTIAGTLAGILCLGVLQNGLNLLAISTFYQTLFIGIVLILASFLRRFGPQT
jgi:ribose transport system permease protein